MEALGIVPIIIAIILLVRWWKMTDNVKALRASISGSHRDLAYLAAIGDKEQLEKTAIVILADKLYSIYQKQTGRALRYGTYDIRTMDATIQPILTQINNLGIQVPNHLKSGEAFVAFIESINGVNSAKKNSKLI